MNRDAHVFHIASAQQGDETVAKPAGNITIDSSPELRRVLLRMLKASGCRRLTIDLQDVPYIDMSCLAVLIEALRFARQLTKDLQLTGFREQPRYLFETAGLLPLFDQSPLPVKK